MYPNKFDNRLIYTISIPAIKNINLTIPYLLEELHSSIILVFTVWK